MGLKEPPNLVGSLPVCLITSADTPTRKELNGMSDLSNKLVR